MKQITALAVVVLLLVSAALFNEYLTFTGYAPAVPQRSPEDLLVDIKVMAADNSLKLLETGTSICVVVEMDNETTYYYELTKKDSITDVLYKYCADPNQNNIIIKFNSYDELLNFKENPKSFIKEKQNIGYYIFPSNYVSQGGAINCNPDFQNKYCGSALYHFTQGELREIKLDCCADYFLPPEKQRMIEELKLGRPPTKEKPFFLSGTFIIFTFIIVVIVIVGSVASVMLRKPKIEPALKDYIENSLSQGYSEEDVKKALIDAGWESKKIDSAFSIIKKQSKK